MSDPIQQMIEAKLSAIALTRAALTRDDDALRALLAGMDSDDALDALGSLISLSASLLDQLFADPVAILDAWARHTIAESVR